MRITLLLSLLLLALICGCEEEPDSGQTSSSTAIEDEDIKPLLDPFDPPPLEEINERVTWVDQPVKDGNELLEQHLADQPEPELTVDEALKLKNKSPEDNEKIVRALGRFPESPEDIDYEATIVRHVNGDVKSTNPIMVSSVAEFDISDISALPIMAFDWTFKNFASAETVVSWQTSEDRMYDKIVLRDDLVWSDGKPITAHDVAFSFQVIMNPRVPVPAVRSMTDKLRWVHAYDDQTIMYFHKEPLATHAENINFPVIPKHIYEDSLEDDFTLQKSEYHAKYEQNPVVGGPYKITKRIRGQEIVLERRDDWYMYEGKQVRDKPRFRRIRCRVITDPNTALQSLKAGEIDETLLTAEQWTTQTDGADFYKRNVKVTGLEWTYFYIGWNCESDLFEDKRVRKAMSYTLDHEEMISTIFHDLYTPCYGIYHETAWMAPDPVPEPYQQNLDKAEELLDAAGWDDSNGDGIRDKMIDGKLRRFEFTIITSQSPNSIKVCKLLAQELDRIGIICHVRPLEFTVLTQRSRDHKFHAMLGGWGTGTDPDTSENLWTTKAIDDGRNYVMYSNPEVDELFEAGKREFDRDKRAEIYAKIHKILWEDQPYTWLFFRNGFYGFNKELRGYHFSPRGPFGYSPGFNAVWVPQ